MALPSTTTFEIDNTAGTSDLGITTALLTFGGSLNVTNIGGTLVAGNSFNLFDWGTTTGTFSSVNLPALGGPLSWDVTSLYTNGTIVIIPEPTTAALLGGLATLVMLRRRRNPRG